MKAPNGYGSITKLSGKRRKPWRVRKTIGWEADPVTGKLRQVYANLGTYCTKKEAAAALAAYNTDPWDLSTQSLTFADVYGLWSKEHFQKIVPSAVRTWESAYNHSAALHKMVMREIKVCHLEQTIINEDVGNATKGRMKSLYNMMYRYALKHEIVDKDYASMCDPVKREPRQIVRLPFTDDEIMALWNNLDIPFANMVLIGIYTGFRPQELATLQVNDIDLDQLTITGGSKTEAGRNRVVPIHPCIQSLVTDQLTAANEIHSAYLFNDPDGQQGTHMTYDKYRGRWRKIMNRLNMEHKPHDTRHTFITLGKTANMNEYILKMIVGHAVTDVTEKVYTHRTIEQFHTEIQKIKAVI